MPQANRKRSAAMRRLPRLQSSARRRSQASRVDVPFRSERHEAGTAGRFFKCNAVDDGVLLRRHRFVSRRPVRQHYLCSFRIPWRLVGRRDAAADVSVNQCRRSPVNRRCRSPVIRFNQRVLSRENERWLERCGLEGLLGEWTDAQQHFRSFGQRPFDQILFGKLHQMRFKQVVNFLTSQAGIDLNALVLLLEKVNDR